MSNQLTEIWLERQVKSLFITNLSWFLNYIFSLQDVDTLIQEPFMELAVIGFFHRWRSHSATYLKETKE